MPRKRHLRRPGAIVLVVLGGIFIYLAPQDMTGLVLLTSGMVLELAGIALERKS